ERDDAAQRRLGQRLAGVERALAVGDLHDEVARLHLEVALERELGRAAGQREVEIVDSILRGDPALAACDVGDEAVLDGDRRRQRGAASSRTTAAARRALRRLWLLRAGAGAERRDVHAAVGGLDHRDDRLRQLDVAELDATGEQREELESNLAGLELQKGLRAELRVVRDFEAVQGEAGSGRTEIDIERNFTGRPS